MKKLFTLSFFLLLLMLGFVGKSWGQLFWNTNGTPASWTSSNWGTSGAGPFTNSWVSGSDVRFTANSTLNFATTTVGNVTVDPGVNVTVIASNTLSFTGGTVKNYDIGAGSTLTWQSQVVTANSAAGITKNGSGTLDIGALNWLTNMNGGFTLNDGLLIVSGNKALGNGSLTINGGNLQSLNNRSFTPTSLIFGGNFTLSGTGDADWNAATSISLGSGIRTITNSTTSGSRSFLGVISGTGGINFTGTGSGSIILATGNTYSGKTQLTGGVVSGPGPDGSLFGANPAGFTSDQITFNGGTFLPTTDINFNSNRGITFTGTGSTINTNTHLVTFTSVCTGTGGFTKSGSSTLLLAGVHTFSGQVTINNGSVKLNASNTYPDASALFVNGGGTFDVNGFSETIGSLASSGGSVTSTSTGTPVLTTGYNNASTTFSGVLSNGSATSLGLTKIGTGTFRLTGNNSFTGPINVNAGTLQLDRAGGTLLNTQSLSVNTNGTLRITQNQTLSNVTLDAGATLTVDAGATLSITGTLTVNTGATINGSGAINYSGVGKLVYNGTGSLTAGIEWPTVSAPYSVTINAGATVVLAANRTTTNLLQIDGTLDAVTFSITGTGNVNINGTLKTANPAGYTGTGATFTGASPVLGPSSTVNYNAAGNQVVTTAGPVLYANLTISVSGTKTVSNLVNISGTLTISDNAIFDGNNQTIGGSGTNLTMTGTSKFITGGNGTKPDPFSSTYSLSSTSTIEFSGTSATIIRVGNPTPSYGNIIVSGSNVSLSSDLASIKMQTGTSFTVTSTGTFNVQSSTGFTDAAGAAVSSTNNPTIDLQNGSTINYNGIAQPLTPRNDYRNLTISGSGAKTAASAFNVAETFTRSGDASLATTSPTYGALATLAYVDAAAGRIYNAGLEWPTTNPPTNLTVNLSGTGTRQVVLPGDRTVASNVALTAGELNINGDSLAINGAITGTGTFTGSSSSKLTLGGAAGTLNFTQTNAATSSLKNLTLGIAGTAKIGNDVNVYGNIKVNNTADNAMDFDGKHVTLKSLSTGTATIDELSASGLNLTGATNVTMERWIPMTNPVVGTGRRYQLLTPTVTTTTSIQANWMEGGQVTSPGGYNDPVPGYGTHITGSSNLANHLDRTQTDQPSLFSTSNGVSPAYTAFTNANGNLNALTGYFLFVRGGRDVSLSLFNTNQAAYGWVNLASSNTTLRATGTIQKGPITAFTNPFVGGTGAWNLVTNPYPAPIDWSKVIRTNVNGSYKYWDPHNGNRGGFIDVDNTGLSTPSANGNQYIQPGQAFFVVASGAGAPTITMEESDKAVGNDNTPVFLMPPKNFSASIFYYEGGINRRLADGVRAVFDNTYSPAFNGEEDALDLANWDENMAINRDGNRLVVDRRPEITAKDTMFLLIDRLKVANYELEFKGESFPNNNITATLIDNFTGGRTGLSTTGTTVVPITVSSNPASAASNRFMVVFENTAGPLPIDISSIKAYEKNNGIQVDWMMSTEQDMDKYEVEKSTDGRHFVKTGTVLSKGNSNIQVNYGWFDANPVVGDNFYRIRAIEKAGTYKYSDIVRVNIGKGISTGISMYPNPFEGNGFNLQLNKFAAGTYTLTMYNSLGQQVYNTTLTHGGGSATQFISLGKDLAAGTYTVKINGEGTTITRTITKK